MNQPLPTPPPAPQHPAVEQLLRDQQALAMAMEEFIKAFLTYKNRQHVGRISPRSVEDATKATRIFEKRSAEIVKKMELFAMSMVDVVSYPMDEK